MSHLTNLIRAHAPLVQSRTATGSTTLTRDDVCNQIAINSASANTVNIPLDSDLVLPRGTYTSILTLGIGVTTIQAPVGISLNGVDNNALGIDGQYGIVTLQKIDNNTWVVYGALA